MQIVKHVLRATIVELEVWKPPKQSVEMALNVDNGLLPLLQKELCPHTPPQTKEVISVPLVTTVPVPMLRPRNVLLEHTIQT